MSDSVTLQMDYSSRWLTICVVGVVPDQPCPKEVDQGLASKGKVIDMRETTKSKSFLQTLHSSSIILGVELVEV